ncbi:hypothetical protein M9458_052791 [Cirrhinus mrigala]|uniref:Up-regulator of cell proliferation-like domain-containing protein n=1 Tax=Cirrhinus mrigala TaxID=683832 RepID=A0ABD0MSB7_CIRMR
MEQRTTSYDEDCSSGLVGNFILGRAAFDSEAPPDVVERMFELCRSVSSSKSQLMNSLINEKHNTFFHRNCPDSSRTRVLMDGVVEIAWFCPSGTNTDKFTECVVFCNLHGDAGDHEKQLQILTEMSSVNVVLLPRLDRNDRHAAKIQNLLEDVSKHSDIRVDEEDDDDCRSSSTADDEFTGEETSDRNQRIISASSGETVASVESEEQRNTSTSRTRDRNGHQWKTNTNEENM